MESEMERAGRDALDRMRDPDGRGPLIGWRNKSLLEVVVGNGDPIDIDEVVLWKYLMLNQRRPDDYRMMRMRFIERRTRKDIARALGTTMERTKQREARLIRLLRTEEARESFERRA